MIIYKINKPVTANQFIELLNNSTLGEHRPVEDSECIAGMVSNSNLVVTAWKNGKLFGIARSFTDFHYACYLSELAVDKKFQGNGIGKQLLKITQEQLGPRCKLVLMAAPGASSYYKHIGFINNTRCWVLEREALERS